MQIAKTTARTTFTKIMECTPLGTYFEFNEDGSIMLKGKSGATFYYVKLEPETAKNLAYHIKERAEEARVALLQADTADYNARHGKEAR